MSSSQLYALRHESNPRLALASSHDTRFSSFADLWSNGLSFPLEALKAIQESEALPERKFLCSVLDGRLFGLIDLLKFGVGRVLTIPVCVICRCTLGWILVVIFVVEICVGSVWEGFLRASCVPNLFMFSAADLAAAIQLSINDHIVSIPPALGGILPPPQVRHENLHSRDGRVSPSGDYPNMKSINDLKDHLSAGSIFKMKRDWLSRELAKGKDGSKSDPSSVRSERRLLQIVIRRDQVFSDSFLQFASLSDDDLRNPLSIHFVGEVGRDDGGVTRDWYSVLSKEIFNPQYGLFTCSAADDYTFQLNPNSEVNPDHLDFFKFIGTIVGKALLDGCLLDAHFTRLVYKRILDKPVTYHDMATVDVQFYKSLVWLLENKLDGMDLGLTFSVDRENYGAYEEIELKPKGREVSVTEANKREYVDLLSGWRLKESVESQFQALRSGLQRIVEPALLQNFDENELEWLIGGLPTIDALDWRKSTVYKAGYSDSIECPVIRWFWQLVDSWDQEMRARLLQFVTGTSKVPYPDGFKGLRGSEGLRPFHIVRVSDSSRLPQAHTCFNELILPDYDSYEELANNLTTAIFETGNQFQLR